MKKWDVVIIVVLIIISLIPEGVTFIINDNKYNNLYVEVYSEEISFTIDNELGENVIKIDKGQVKIIDADCPDQICVKAHAISKLGESIICLPHKLVVKITGEGKQETDEVSF